MTQIYQLDQYEAMTPRMIRQLPLERVRWLIEVGVLLGLPEAARMLGMTKSGLHDRVMNYPHTIDHVSFPIWWGDEIRYQHYFTKRWVNAYLEGGNDQ